MGEDTRIPWCHHTFNAWHGCAKVSAGCDNCYAERDSNRWGFDVWGPDKPRRRLSESHWKQPFRWDRKAAKAGERHRVFMMSMGDIFEDRRDLDGLRAKAFSLVEGCPHLDWLILTKRIENWERLVPRWWADDGWPPNAWAMVTVEDQAAADTRIPLLLQVPAGVRGVSVEPMLGQVDLGLDSATCDCCPRWGGRWVRLPREVRSEIPIGQSIVGPGVYRATGNRHGALSVGTPGGPFGIKPGEFAVLGQPDLVICGAESGLRRRPPPEDGHRSLRDQCVAAGVPYFLKQWPGEDGGLVRMPTLDGRVWDDMPSEVDRG